MFLDYIDVHDRAEPYILPPFSVRAILLINHLKTFMGIPVLGVL